MDYILGSRSPVCDMTALIDRDVQTYYLHLVEHADSKPEFSRSLWIANRIPAPPNVEAAMQMHGFGRHLPMPAPYVTHDPRGIELDPQRMTIVWYPSGDGAAAWSTASLPA